LGTSPHASVVKVRLQYSNESNLGLSFYYNPG
jgi:hypothetical protein